MAAGSKKPSLGKAYTNDEEGQMELKIEVKVAAWMQQQVAAEIAKFKSQGANAIPMSVSNMCIVREEDEVVNRVEMDTKFDFELIQEIHHSDPIDCPYKAGYVYCNVLLFTDKPLPIIIPYLYQPDPANTLHEWLFLNADAKRVRHHVGSYHG